MRIHGITPQPTDDPRVFTLPSAPDPPESLQLFRNGILQHPGLEFELTGERINFPAGPDLHDWLRAWYEVA
jgi:hypothetical protein